MGMTSSERRRRPRRPVVWAVELDRQDGRRPKLAVTRNLSAGGALLLARGRFQPGERLRARFQVPGLSEKHIEVDGEVLRSAERDEAYPWSHTVAVCFHEEAAILEAHFPPDAA